MSDDLAGEYASRHSTLLCQMASSLEDHLTDLLMGAQRIDRVSARAKSPDRFMAKALKKDDAGRPKYDDPIHQIQDQIGARIIVFYLQDVDKIRDVITSYMTAIEIQKKEPLGDSEFGYFGEHFILKIPDEIIPDGREDESPEFFELQIKTLFQHAWSEADHDLGYKSVRNLSPLEKRQVAFSAAQSWGADQVFAQLANALVFANDQDSTMPENK
ncbi:MAG: RelA/SpoT domain-containing protein [Novosphingobium sp.]|nr:RelA/SpoT domain-containing protein [Novosphingobium sp.]